MRSKLFLAAIIFLLYGTLSTCSYDIVKPTGNYPDDIANIFISKCATAGCHDTQSKDGAGGFDLSTWNHLFEGGRNGSSVIPYRADQSFLMYFVNTYPDLGLTLLPLMPYNQPSLARDEVITIRDWIQNGAPDRNGKIKFSDDPNRKKFYVCNQGCDNVTVFDSKTRLAMRVIDVGVTPQIESTHDIEVSHDGKYWYTVFYAGDVIQKFSTVDDSFVGQCTIGVGTWSTMAMSEDSHYAFIVDWSSNGYVALVNLQTMTLVVRYQGLFVYPHGSAVRNDFKTLYLTAQTGNYIYKVDITDPLNPVDVKIVLEPGQPLKYTNLLDPHQIEISPDGTKYYVTCQKSNEVRVFKLSNDSLLKIISDVINPQEPEFSETQPYLFVSCMNDSISFPGKIGCIAVINYDTDSLATKVFSGFQPHGLYVDDNAGLVYIANRNISTMGPAPHHSSNCGGRNGYVTILDMNTLELLPGYKIEVLRDPYEVAVKN